MARTAGSFGGVTGPRVLSTAQRLFARHGYAAVSMRQIASEVGVQAGALYNYIPDKQSLLFDLMRTHMDEVLQAWEDEPHPTGDPLAELEAFTRFHVRFHLERREAVFIAYMELRNLDPENLEALLARRKAYEESLTDILRRAKAARLVSISDPKVAAYGVIAMLTGVQTWFKDGGDLSREKVADIYWEMTRGAVGAMRG
ncbi:TetR/AcrR family transcriptional regulator [Fluviibacterium sp. DFM31]|uniref:TetR/AcrR family transcriptional regulator n=1 Tax=Meridianimarinicoccus marinus TaxID=3231483 RepID=A0ABV3LAL7_9RHOB